MNLITMKKIISLIVFGFALISFFSLEAQSGFGFSAGINYSTFKNTGVLIFGETGPEAGPVIGVFYRGELGKKWALLPEVQYSSKGFSFDNGVTDEFSRLKVIYLDLLPQVEFRPANFLGIIAGVNLGYKLNEKLKSPGEDWADPFSEFKNDLDFGALFGLRFNFNRVNLKIHYNHGILNSADSVFTDANGTLLGSLTQYNQNLQLSAGYLLFR